MQSMEKTVTRNQATHPQRKALERGQATCSCIVTLHLKRQVEKCMHMDRSKRDDNGFLSMTNTVFLSMTEINVMDILQILC